MVRQGTPLSVGIGRWLIKTQLQIIVCADGSAGINFEHTGVDGHTVLRFAADIFTDGLMLLARSINPSAPTLFHAPLSPYAKSFKAKKPSAPKPSPPSPTGTTPASQIGADGKAIKEGEGPKKPNGNGVSVSRTNSATKHAHAHATIAIDTVPKKLEWTLGPELRAGIRFAETRLSDLICQNDCQALEFNTYGKVFITTHGFSPDAFVQMAFQAAYYGLYGAFSQNAP